MTRNNSKTTPPHLKPLKRKAFDQARKELNKAQMSRLNRLEDSGELSKVWELLFEGSNLQKEFVDSEPARVSIVSKLLRTAVQAADIFSMKRQKLPESKRKQEILKLIAALKRLKSTHRTFGEDSPLKMWAISGLAKLGVGYEISSDVAEKFGDIFDAVLTSAIRGIETSESVIKLDDPTMPSHQASTTGATEIYVQRKIARVMLHYYGQAFPSAIARISDIVTDRAEPSKPNTVNRVIQGLPKNMYEVPDFILALRKKDGEKSIDKSGEFLI